MIDQLIEKLKINKTLFFNIFIILFSMSKAWGLDSSDRMYYVLATVAAVFWAFAIVGTNYELKEFFLCGLLLVISAISLLCSGKIGAILPAMVIVAAKDTSIDDVIRIMMRCWLITVMSKVILVIVGVIPNRIQEKYTELSHGEYSYTMGYVHPNLFALSVSICVILILYIYWDNIKWWWSLVIVALAISVFSVSLCYTGTAIILVTAVWCLISGVATQWEKLRLIMNSLMVAVSMAAMISIFVLSRIIGISESLDIVLLRLTAHRTHVSRNMMDVYSIKLFGQRFDGRAGYEILDNAYVYTLLQLGVIMFCLMMLAYLCCIIRTYRNRDTRILFILTVLIVYGFMEQSFINPFINFSWLFIADMIWNKNASVSRGVLE